MAEVYEVEDVGLGSRYALKLFTYARSEEASARARFFAEGRLLAKLDHPRLVRVYDIGEDATTGHPYFVMDLVLGPDGKPTTLADAEISMGGVPVALRDTRDYYQQDIRFIIIAASSTSQWLRYANVARGSPSVYVPAGILLNTIFDDLCSAAQPPEGTSAKNS